MEPVQVELTVRSAVLCARMKAHQKSQLVRLLSKGLQVDDNRNLKVCFVRPSVSIQSMFVISFCAIEMFASQDQVPM